MSERRSESSLAQVKSKIKVVFLGDQSTGKTSILLRFMHDKFQDGLSATVGIDFMAKNYNVGNIGLRLQLWDTAGQQRFRSLIPSYLKDATVTFILFDITNYRSFENIRQWLQLCHQNRREKSITVLLGNKSDLASERQVSVQQAEQKAKKEGIKYFEVSAKQNININEAFKYAVQQYIKKTQISQTSFSESLAQNSGGLNKLKTNHNAFENPISKNGEIHLQNISNKESKKKGCC